VLKPHCSLDKLFTIEQHHERILAWPKDGYYRVLQRDLMAKQRVTVIDRLGPLQPQTTSSFSLYDS
jgi:hypothetical protein